MERRRAVFLDRDGTINEEVGYLRRLRDLRLIPGAAAAIRRLNAAGFVTVVVTNQSGIARGYFDEAFVAAVHERLAGLLRTDGARLDGFYHCPHHPTEGRGEFLQTCACRKPAPGLLLKAIEDFRIDPAGSFMIGDTLKDIEAGARAGVRGILVRTGYGHEELAKLEGGTLRGATAGESPSAGGKAASPSSPQAGGPKDPWRPHRVAADLSAAVDWILGQKS